MSALSTLWRKTTFWLKVLYATGALVTAASYGAVASILFALIRRRGLAQYTTGKLFYYLLRPVIGIKVRYVGDNYDKYFKPSSFLPLFTRDQGTSLLDFSQDGSLIGSDQFIRPCVIVSNHQSALDVYLIGKIFPPFCSVTAKKSLQYVPFLGWFMTLSGTVFLDRKNSASSVKTLNGAVDNFLMRNRQSVFLFPEGTRSYTKVPQLVTPLKKGAFHLAIQSQIPIVPVAISNTSTLLDTSQCLIRPGTIEIKVLDPIPTTGMTRNDVNKLASQVEKVMSEAIEELGYSQVDGEEKRQYKPLDQPEPILEDEKKFGEHQPLLD